jgi:hypothetical protein
MTTPTPETLNSLLLAAMDMPRGECRSRAIANVVSLAARYGYATEPDARNVRPLYPPTGKRALCQDNSALTP